MEQQAVPKAKIVEVYRHDLTETEEDIDFHSPKLNETVMSFLMYINPMMKFQSLIQVIINQSVKHSTDWTLTHAATAFLHLEKFALHLVEFPWRREFKTIKMYTGFWKLKIERHLYSVIPLFERMGYTTADGDTLQLKTPASKKVLLEIAVDCYVASKEIELYGEILKMVDSQGFKLHDVHMCRSTIAGNKENAADWINRNCKPSFKKLQDRFETSRDVFAQGNHSSDRSSRGGSLERAAEPSTAMALEQLEIADNHGDSGYISKPTSQELGRVGGAAKPQAVLPNEYIESPDFPLPPPPRISSIEDDLYAPKTMDDHINQSYSFIEKTNAKGEAAKHQGSAEWDHVRMGLKKKFGEDYYAGIRGDILDSGYHTQPTMPPPSASSGNVIVTADVHKSTSNNTITSTSSPVSPGAKLAGINKSTSRRAPPPPPPAKPSMSCAQQAKQQMSGADDLFHSAHLQTDSSPEIKHPPLAPPTYPLLGTNYQAPNFSTFGVDQGGSNMVNQPGGANHHHHHPGGRGSQDYQADLFGLQHGYDGLTRRMYQADSNTSLNKDVIMSSGGSSGSAAVGAVKEKPDSPVYSKPMKRVIPPSPATAPIISSNSNNNQQQQHNHHQHHHHHQQQQHTAPIIPRRPAPAVPTRVHRTEPLMSQLKQCSACTFMNPSGSSDCQMCGNTLI